MQINMWSIFSNKWYKKTNGEIINGKKTIIWWFIWKYTMRANWKKKIATIKNRWISID